MRNESLNEIIKKEKEKNKNLKELSNTLKFEKIIENSAPMIVVDIGCVISAEAERLRLKFGKEILYKSDLVKHFQTSDRVISEMIREKSFPCISLAEHKNGVTPFALTLWSLTRSSTLDRIVSTYGEVMK